MPGETEKNRLYTSGQMAELNGVSRKTLRLYQQKGVLEPKYVDESSGYRYYTIEQIAQLDLIQKLQAVGLTLQQIGELLKQNDIGALEQCMREQAASLDATDRAASPCARYGPAAGRKLQRGAMQAALQPADGGMDAPKAPSAL